MKKIIISRTDSIGDVVLTLPLAGMIKKYFPDCKVVFLGRAYTKPVIGLCRFIDDFLDWDEIAGSRQSPVGSPQSAVPGRRPVAGSQKNWSEGVDVILHVFPVKEICKAAKEAGIPLRIATARRFFTIPCCNRFVFFSRRNSDLHEVQLNLKMLEAVGIREEISLKDVPEYYGITPPLSLPHPRPLTSLVKGTSPLAPLLKERGKKRVVLHPKSGGSAREWGLENYSRLIDLLSADDYEIAITGTKDEGASMKDFLDAHASRITDLTGKLTLTELIQTIGQCHSLVAASTGPLHIAAALGKRAIGLYAPMRPIHPGRWAPVGSDAHYLVLDKNCSKCRKSGDCECIRNIRPEEVRDLIAG